MEADPLALKHDKLRLNQKRQKENQPEQVPEKRNLKFIVVTEVFLKNKKLAEVAKTVKNVRKTLPQHISTKRLKGRSDLAVSGVKFSQS